MECVYVCVCIGRIYGDMNGENERSSWEFQRFGPVGETADGWLVAF